MALAAGNGSPPAPVHQGRSSDLYSYVGTASSPVSSWGPKYTVTRAVSVRRLQEIVYEPEIGDKAVHDHPNHPLFGAMPLTVVARGGSTRIPPAPSPSWPEPLLPEVQTEPSPRITSVCS